MSSQSLVSSDLHSKKTSCLVQYSGAKLGRRFNLNANVLIIGSSRHANIVLEEPGILPEHARIKYSNSGFILEPIGDTEDIALDDKPIIAATNLLDGSILQIGNVLLKFFADFSVPENLLHAKVTYLQASQVSPSKSSDLSKDSPMIMTTISLLVLSLALVGSAFYLADIDVLTAAKLTPLLLLHGNTIGFMLSTFPLPIHASSLRVAFTGKIRNRNELRQALSYFKCLGQMGLISGFLCFLIAMSVVVAKQSAPGEIGSAVALGILSMAYSFVFRMLAYGKAEHLQEILNDMIRSDGLDTESTATTSATKSRLT